MDRGENGGKAPLITQPIFQIVVMIVIVVGAFFMGSLWTKVSVLEKNGPAAPAQPSGAANDQEAAQPSAPGEKPKLVKDDHIRGDKNARIILFEYSDYECPFCKTFHITAKQVLDDYKGQVAWVYRHYPLSFHANAQKQAEAAECAGDLGGNDAFWTYSDILYERTTSNGTGFALDKLGPLAAEIGLSQSQFQECLDSGKYTQKVKDQMAQGTKEGVQGTPGNILLDTKTGDVQAIPGAVPVDQIKNAIDGMLK